MRAAVSKGLAALGITAAAIVPVASGQAAPPEPDGTVIIDNVRVPPSSLLSPEGKEYLRHLIIDKPFGSGPPLADIKAERARQDGIMRTFLTPMLKRYAVKTSEQKIGGVLVDVVEPASGSAPENRNRVLINLHGGGFTTGARTAALVESVPLAATMRIKVISIDYRMAPEYRFPAASEDVAAVYREVLKTTAPKRIGIYGCSAGGMLAAEAVAWFQKHNLPRPGAVGVFCASLGPFGPGDSAALGGALLGSNPPPKPAGAPRPAAPRLVMSYFAGVADNDPLAYPKESPEVMAKFPPTLFLSGTRSIEFSAALDSHNRLTAAGVPSHFHGWDGMFHGFIYNSELPESRQAYQIMTNFFGKYLAR